MNKPRRISFKNEEVLSLMNYPMRPDLKIGARFPDFELPDHSGNRKRLSHLLRNMPGVLVFSRGYF